MSNNSSNKPSTRGGGNKPRLTHFLCIPLVNAVSGPQLVKSLAEFKASIPPTTSPEAARAAVAGHVFQTSLVPDRALRPLGTLHLTLGVMSLPDQARFQEAADFLNSLDLASILHEAEIEALSSSPSQSTASPAPTPGRGSAPKPLNITLTSLFALPNPKSATILHAHPLDSTSRLYPFCVKLREKFIEAGFMHRDMTRDSRTGKERPRPLLLHATICNTIYLPKQKSSRGKNKRGGHHGGRDRSVYKFDATELLERFGGQPVSTSTGSAVDETELPDKAIPRALQYDRQHAQDEEDRGEGKGKGKQVEYKIESDAKRQGLEPFIWAKDIPIDRVCISEMGAKPVPEEVDGKDGFILGEAYITAAERRLFSSS